MKILKMSLAILLAVTMLLSLCACSFNIPSFGDINPTVEEVEDDNNDTDKDDDKSNSNSVNFEETIELEDCKIVLVGAEAVKDYDEKPVLRLWLEVTNTSDETNSAGYMYDFEATQDDYDLADAYADSDYYVPEEYNNSKRIRPGVTIRLIEEVSFKETGGMVKVKFFDYWDEDEAEVVEIDPAKLPGAPKKEFTPEKVKNPQWIKDYKTEGVYEDYDDEKYEIKIEDFEYTEDYDDNKLIRVYFTFKNTSSEDKSFDDVFYPYAFQDGIQLNGGYPDDEIDEDDNDEQEIEPGKSTRVARCYVLNGDSPVEIEIYDYNDSKIGTVFEVK